MDRDPSTMSIFELLDGIVAAADKISRKPACIDCGSQDVIGQRCPRCEAQYQREQAEARRRY